MTVSTSDGQTFNSEAEYELSQRPKDLGPITTNKDRSLHVDTSKDVPLAASALHKDGEFYGIAVDKDAPQTDMGIPGWSPWLGVYRHEQSEFEHMKNLKAAGMSDQDAYHEAHDRIATPTETAYVRGIAAQNGKDPDQFLDDYKSYWRDVAKKAGEPPFDRHPDAHTTTFHLDDTELPPEVKHHLQEVVQERRDAAQGFVKHLVQPFESLGKIMTGQGEASDIPEAASNFMPGPKMAIFGGMAAKGALTNFLEKGALRGSDNKLRFEIPDIFSRITLNKSRAAVANKGRTTLQDVLDHPDLYKAYPDLKHVLVFKDLALGKNNAYQQGNKIVLGEHTSEDILKQTLLHEVQHWIQEKEGFSRGASVHAMEPYVKKALESAVEKGKFKEDELPFKLTPDNVKNFVKEQSREYYRRTAGEVESRNVERRSTMTPAELKANPPETTEDILREMQLSSPLDLLKARRQALDAKQ